MGQGRNWTQEEKQYLEDNWGTLSKQTLAKNLNRSLNAIEVMKNRLRLGAFLDNGDYVTWNQLQIALGLGRSGSGYKMISWVKNRDFPIRTKKVGNNSFKIVKIDDFWKWAEQNKDLLDFTKFEKNAIGEEPAWTKEKRKHDFEKARKYVNTPWTKAEDEKLKYLLRQYKYTYDDLSKMLKRTNGAIQRRVCDLGIKDRPIKADNHVKWTDEDFGLLGELIKQGYGYELIAEKIGKSAKAIRGRVYSMYLTENLDKARMIIGKGSWGDNRPERTISQWNVMNTEERKQVKDLVIRLAAIIRFEYKQFFDDCDYWQKDLCQHWDGFCTKCQVNCDECTEFLKINPQNCKRCGNTFYERKDNKFCNKCREQKKKQYLRKIAILNGFEFEKAEVV